MGRERERARGLIILKSIWRRRKKKIFLQVARVEGDHVEHSDEETEADSVEKNEEEEGSNDEGADDDG